MGLSLASLDSLALLENKKAYSELVALGRRGVGGGRKDADVYFLVYSLMQLLQFIIYRRSAV